MFEWWNSLGITMQVFYCIAIPGNAYYSDTDYPAYDR